MLLWTNNILLINKYRGPNLIPTNLMLSELHLCVPLSLFLLKSVTLPVTNSDLGTELPLNMDPENFNAVER